MRRRLARALVIGMTAFSVTATLGGAQDTSPALARVRGASPDGTRLLDELVARSTTGRELVAQLGRSDLIVFIRAGWFQTQTLRARIGFVAANGMCRVFAIEINAHLTRTEQLAALGHELQHALEIAGAAAVHDVGSLANFYATIGAASGSPGAETYETEAADAMGQRVRHELAGRLPQTAHTPHN